MSLHLKWFKVYFHATPIHSLRIVTAWQRAGAIQNITYGICEKCRLISFEGSIRFFFGNIETHTSKTWSRGYKTFFVLNSVEHEILNAHKYKNIKKFGLFKAQLSLECYFSRSYMLKCQQLS